MVVDLPQVAFHISPKAGESGRGLVKAFRFGPLEWLWRWGTYGSRP